MDKFEFELNMDDSYKNCETIDEWGMATIWAEDYGAEYNLCLQNGDNYSAIYFMEYDDETDDPCALGAVSRDSVVSSIRVRNKSSLRREIDSIFPDQGNIHQWNPVGPL